MHNICQYCDNLRFSEEDYKTYICFITKVKITNPKKETCDKFVLMDYAF